MAASLALSCFIHPLNWREGEQLQHIQHRVAVTRLFEFHVLFIILRHISSCKC